MKLAISILLISLSLNSFSQNKDIKKDSTTKQYVLKITLSPLEWKAITDTSSMVVSEFGRSMSVDESLVYKSALIRQLNFISRKIIVDSTYVQPKK